MQIYTAGKKSQGRNKFIKSVSMWHLSIMQATLGAIKAFRRSEGLGGSVQDIKSDKPSGLHYQTSREAKLKQGVSLNCPYPCSGNSIGQGKVMAGRKEVGTSGD